MSSPFAADLQEYRRVDIEGVEVWFTKLEEHLKSNTVEQTAALLGEIRASAAALHGGILEFGGPKHDEAVALFRRRVQLCGELSIDTMVVSPGMADEFQPGEVKSAIDRLKLCADFAQEHDVRLALEFHCRAPFCNNLESALALVESCGQPGLGVCLDAFHFWCGPSKLQDLQLLTSENLYHVQFSDLIGIPREFARDSDRILPGDGEIPLAAIIHRLNDINYAGAVSIELMNPTLWAMSCAQVAEIAITSLRKLFGQNATGSAS